MAHHDSANERTILWTIIPAAVLVTLLFVWRNHKINGPKEPVRTEIQQADPAVDNRDTTTHTTPTH